VESSVAGRSLRRVSEPEYVARTRAGYDAVAEDCAAPFRAELERSALDRALLTAFAELVRTEHPDARVVEVGSGPGAITDHLARQGLSITGIDLSPGMVDVARSAYPELDFRVGDMRELREHDLAGLVSWYSLIHIPPADRPAVLAGFARAVRPGGYLLLGFQVGTDIHHRSEAWGKEISLDFHRLDPDAVVDLLAAAGFELVSRSVRAPERGSTAALVPQACLIARRRG
jgi:SAM-dependent methyltransferase